MRWIVKYIFLVNYWRRLTRFPLQVRPSRDSRHFSLGGVGHSKTVREARTVPTCLLCFSLAGFASANSRAQCENNLSFGGNLRSRSAQRLSVTVKMSTKSHPMMFLTWLMVIILMVRFFFCTYTYLSRTRYYA